MKSLLTILSFFLLQKSFAQDSIHVFRHYDNEKPTTSIDTFFYNIRNTVFVSLDEGFNDSLYITVNDAAVLNTYLRSNESIGYAGEFQIHFDNPSDTKILRLKFVNENFYIEEKVNLTYKSLQIRGLMPWLLVYTNHFPIRE
jgi:hypothetical protein